MSDKKITLTFADDESTDIQKKQDENNEVILRNAGIKTTDLLRQAVGSATSNSKKIPRIAFEKSSLHKDTYAGIFSLKKDLLPPQVIKRIRVENLLVAAILRTRGNMMSMCGHPRKDRFDLGIEINIKPEYKDHIKPEEMVKIQERIDHTMKVLVNCGHTDGLDETEKMSLSDYFYLQTQNGLSFGWHTTEVIYDVNAQTKEKRFHRFRPVDAGTIFPASRKNDSISYIRDQSIRMLKELQQNGKTTINPVLLERDYYNWVQVVDGFPRQAFADDELLVYNMFPSTDIEHKGFPVTPLDTAMLSITTYSSIEVYNKLYFQNGKGAKGILVVKSGDGVDQSTLEDIKQQYNASINNVSNAFRTPVFGVGKEDDIVWQTTQPNRDGDFQYLFDQTIRNILSAFNMSPEEIPGFGHLAKGTNAQALSEASNEFKLTAARDGGLRPMVLKFQDFLTNKLFPLIDPELSQLCYIDIAGIDSETREKEAQRLSTDMSIHMTYDEVMDNVDKDLVGKSMGGGMPFNERYRQILDTYKSIADIERHFMNCPVSVIDPLKKYKRDPFFFQYLEMLGQANPDAFMAFFSTRKDAKELALMLIQDFVEENID